MSYSLSWNVIEIGLNIEQNWRLKMRVHSWAMKHYSMRYQKLNSKAGRGNCTNFWDQEFTTKYIPPIWLEKNKNNYPKGSVCILEVFFELKSIENYYNRHEIMLKQHGRLTNFNSDNYALAMLSNTRNTLILGLAVERILALATELYSLASEKRDWKIKATTKWLQQHNLHFLYR